MRCTTPIAAWLFLLQVFAGIAGAGEAVKPPAVRLSVGPGGMPSVLTEAAFSAWTPEAAAAGAQGWVEVARALVSACKDAGPAAAPAAPEDAAKYPIRLLLRWNPTISKCKVYVGQVLCNYNEEGLARAATKIEQIVQTGAKDLAVDFGNDVPCRWLMAAARMAEGRITGKLLLAAPNSFPDDPGFAEALDEAPAVEPKEGPAPDVAVQCLLHPDAPASAVGRLAAVLGRLGVRGVLLGSAPAALHAFTLGAADPAGGSGIRTYGGGRHTESAVRMGLAWLRDHQDPGGGWSGDRFMRQCKRGACDGPGASASHDAGLTGLALLAFLGAGNTHKRGDFRETVKEALKALHDLQEPDGRFGPASPGGTWFYDHAICTLAAVEAYGLTGRSELLAPMATKGLNYLLRCQNAGLGWRYGLQPGDCDTSCTAWAAHALAAAKMTGLSVPDEAVNGALLWFDKVTDKATWRAGYLTAGDAGGLTAEAAKKFQPSEAMTAAAVFSRILFVKEKTAGLPAIRGGAERLQKNPPKWDLQGGTIDYYYWYWGTLAAFQAGDPTWKPWNEAMKNALVPTQRREACETGSWDPVDAWGATGGRVYATAMNTLTLEIYYRYGRFMEGK